MPQIKSYWQNYIDGRWVDGSGGRRLAVEDPATGKPFAEIACAGSADVDAAVQAARRAVAGRALYEMKPDKRCQLLYAMAREIRALGDEIVPVLTTDNGKNLDFSRDEVEGTARYFEYYAGMADKIHGRSIPLGEGYLDYTQLVPYGVSAQVVPWNFPLELAGRSLAPALAGANAVVVKSPELSPLAICFLATAAERAGLPKGYLNIICGTGEEAGEALTSHPGIDHIVFTGSVATGRKIMHQAADRVAPCVMEMGGKSAGIVYPDADLETTPKSAAIAILAHAGQVCSAGSRLIVHRSVHDELVDRILAVAKGFTMGPGVENHFLTPVISKNQLDKIERYCQSGIQAGAHAVTGGRRADRPGHFMAPTIFTGVTTDMLINREEIFGPVLSVLSFDNPDEALSIANGTDYGLAAGIYTRDLGRAHWTADRLEAGTVFVNQWFAGGNEVPFGGFKRSGFGREKGVEALANYVQTRNVAIHI
jgi:aldehyde dehydrogenase (NAD+)/betaine-aldehyde dehydrogenase